MFMNDLSNSIQHSTLSGYADDTQIFYADKEIAKIEQVINTDLRNADKWYDENGMTRNPAKYQAMIMGKTQELPKFSCDNTAIPITNEIELLGVTTYANFVEK